MDPRDPRDAVTDYPLAPALRARLLGVLLVLLGALCFVATALIGLAHLPEWLLLVLVGVVVLAGIFHPDSIAALARADEE